MSYRLAHETPNFVVLKSASYSSKIWVEVKVRKDHRCAQCGEDNIKKGDNAWRPITHGGNRMHRICPTCIDELKE